jgi:starch synthase
LLILLCLALCFSQVPADAHVLDVVFADSESAQSFHDDNGGLDYHIPIEGGKGVMPGLKV